MSAWIAISKVFRDRKDLILERRKTMLEHKLSPSTLKVYVSANTAHHDKVESRSLEKYDLIIRFLRGARRSNPPKPCPIPSWDPSEVFSGQQRAPFESVELKILSLKTALLTSLTSIKMLRDLQVYSVN